MAHAHIGAFPGPTKIDERYSRYIRLFEMKVQCQKIIVREISAV